MLVFIWSLVCPVLTLSLLCPYLVIICGPLLGHCWSIQGCYYPPEVVTTLRLWLLPSGGGYYPHVVITTLWWYLLGNYLMVTCTACSLHGAYMVVTGTMFVRTVMSKLVLKLVLLVLGHHLALK